VKNKKERKSKYAVPHYDRMSPRVRYAARAGHRIMAYNEVNAESFTENSAFPARFQEEALNWKNEDGEWESESWDQYGSGQFGRDRSLQSDETDEAYTQWDLNPDTGEMAVCDGYASDYCDYFLENKVAGSRQGVDGVRVLTGNEDYSYEWEDYDDSPKSTPVAVASYWHWNASTDLFLLCESVCCHEFDRYGQQVFSLSPLIGEMLENTDLGAITFSDLRLPFDCFYVQLEGNQKYSGFYVSKIEEVVTFVAVRWHEEMPDDRWPEKLEYWEPNEDCLNRGDYWRFFFQLYLDKYDEECTVEKAIDSLMQGTPANDHWTEEERALHRYETCDYDEATRDILRLTFSLLFYLNSERKSVEVSSGKDEREKQEAALAASGKTPSSRSSKKNKRRKEKLRYLSNARFHQVGAQEERDLTSRPGFDIDQPRHWRRGHLHRYWVGSRKDADGNPRKGEKRIRLWILPTLINPEGEIEDCTHRLVVKKEQEALVAKIQREGGEIVIPEQSKRERNPSLRNPCIAHHGAFCNLYPYCSEDGSRFGPNKFNKSGNVGGWLHVHHLDPLGDAVEERNVDPLTDLVPVCGTCHGFIHSRRPAYSVEEAREIMKRWQEEEEEEAAK